MGQGAGGTRRTGPAQAPEGLRTAGGDRSGRRDRPQGRRLRPPRRRQADRGGLRPRRRGACAAAARGWPALHRPSGRGRRHPGRLPARHRDRRDRAAARHGRGYRRHPGRDREALRQGSRPAGRWRHQADAPRTAIRTHQAGREFPQAGPGHERGHPRPLVKLADRLHNMRTIGGQGQPREARCAPRARRWRSTPRSPSASAWTRSRPRSRRCPSAR